MNCPQPGCDGQIVDGYCDICGMAPPRPSAAAAPSVTNAVVSPMATTAGRSVATAMATGSASRLSTSRTRSPGRSRLGAGLVEIAPAAAPDPATAVMSDPRVAESRRFCSNCDAPVGRSRNGKPGLEEGFCAQCRTLFSFEPKLKQGDLLGGQYEVAGCLAHGGMGWVYLARDRNVSDRWVVLKGLLNAGDRDATAAALAEQRFLAEVEHPNIVKIFNFVQDAASGYIVMEYVGGESLKQVVAARREANGGQPDPLPPTQAIAYILETLPALGYLHDHGLLFCDFKLDNVIHSQHSVKLIDLGGVYRIDEPSSAIFGTVGYQAPEIATAGPSVSSDLFTVARTLAVLCIDFRGYQGTHRYTLPGPDSVPLFAQFDSLYQFLLKGTAPDPEDRFQSADEMAEQLRGVLREIIAEQEQRPVPAPSALFTSPLRAGPDRPDWRVLPSPQVDRDDPSAGYLAAVATTSSRETIAQLEAAPERTIEVELRLAAALIEAGDRAEAEALLAGMETGEHSDWRISWHRGVAHLVGDRPTQARERFDAVYRTVPGELAPKLALGLACEDADQPADARRWYGIVARTDPSITSAVFGLARCCLAVSDRYGAIAAYEQLPDSSSGYVDAQTARIRCLNRHDGVAPPAAEDVLQAGSILEQLPVDGEQRDRLTTELLGSALSLALHGRSFDEGRSLLGNRLTERGLRTGLERAYRSLARRAGSRAEQIQLVDEANRVRPRTWV
jgi:serine/threonine-protein kinase PknG